MCLHIGVWVDKCTLSAKLVCAYACVLEIDVVLELLCEYTDVTTLCFHYRTDGEAFIVPIISPRIASAELPANRTQQRHSGLT